MVVVTSKEIYNEVLATKELVTGMRTRIMMHERILWSLGGGIVSIVFLLISHLIM